MAAIDEQLRSIESISDLEDSISVTIPTCNNQEHFDNYKPCLSMQYIIYDHKRSKNKEIMTWTLCSIYSNDLSLITCSINLHKLKNVRIGLILTSIVFCSWKIWTESSSPIRFSNLQTSLTG